MGPFSKRRHFAGHWEMESQQEDEQMPAGIKSLPHFLLWNFQVFLWLATWLCLKVICLQEDSRWCGNQVRAGSSLSSSVCQSLSGHCLLRWNVHICKTQVINVVEVGALNWVLFEVSQRASALLQQWQENNDSKILRGVSSPEGGNTDWPVSLCRKITDSFAFSF